MSSTHRIRLRGFWEATPLTDGRTRHVRRFGRPRTLDPGETAWVVGDAGPAAVFLNGEEVGRAEAGPFAFEALLRPRVLPVPVMPPGAVAVKRSCCAEAASGASVTRALLASRKIRSSRRTLFRTHAHRSSTEN